jgi:hypothetical protein
MNFIFNFPAISHPLRGHLIGSLAVLSTIGA